MHTFVELVFSKNWDITKTRSQTQIRERIHRDDHHPSLAKPLSFMATIYGTLGRTKIQLLVIKEQYPSWRKFMGIFILRLQKDSPTLGMTYQYNIII